MYTFCWIVFSRGIFQGFRTVCIANVRKCFSFVTMTSAKRVTPTDIRQIAEQIRLIADGYSQLAEAMENTGVGEFEASGIDTLRDVTIARLDGTLERNRSRFMRLSRARMAADLTAKLRPASQMMVAETGDDDHEDGNGQPLRTPAKPAAKSKSSGVGKANVDSTVKQPSQAKPKRRKSG